MDKEEILSLMDVQRKTFNDVMDRLHFEMREDRNENNKQMNELTRSLEFSQREIDQLKAKLTEIHRERECDVSKIKSLLDENLALKEKVKELNERADFLDDQGRRHNLRFSGITEGQSENWQQSQQKITRLLNDCFEISPSAALIDRAHRVGRSSQHRPRDIIVRFSSMNQRDAILRDRTKLRGTQVYVNEDFCPGTIEAQKSQMESYHSARRNGKIVYFNRKTLITRERDLSSRQGGVQLDRDPSTPTPLSRGQRESDTFPSPRTPSAVTHAPLPTGAAQTPRSGVSANDNIGSSVRRLRNQQSNTQVGEASSPITDETREEAVGGVWAGVNNGRGKARKDAGATAKVSRRGRN